MPGHHVDVNVHPTKREVHFLHEEALLEALCERLRGVLAGSNQSRTFYMQETLPGAHFDSSGTAEAAKPRASNKKQEKEEDEDEDFERPLKKAKSQSSKVTAKATKATGAKGKARAVAPVQLDELGMRQRQSSKRTAPAYVPQKMVRVDASDRRIDSIFMPTQRSQLQSTQATQGSPNATGPTTGPGTADQSMLGAFDSVASSGSQSQSQEDLCVCLVPAIEPSTVKGNGQFKAKRKVKGKVAAAIKPFAGIGGSCECCGKKPNHKVQASGRIQQHKRPAAFRETRCEYTSIRNLLADIKSGAHKGLRELLRNNTFVGMLSTEHSLLQFQTKLVLVHHTALAREAFYQMAIRRFGVLPALKLANPVNVTTFVRAALDLPESRWSQQDGPKDELADGVACLLASKAALLKEYFSIGLEQGEKDEKGEGKSSDLLLTQLPVLIEGSTPLPEALPKFLLRMGTDVDWEEEQMCFEGVAMELARLYGELPEADDSPDESEQPLGKVDGEGKCSSQLVNPKATSIVEAVWYPGFRWALTPPKEFASDGTAGTCTLYHLPFTAYLGLSRPGILTMVLAHRVLMYCSKGSLLGPKYAPFV
ncbi:unnamed protein product [Chrysoparadoxa australica]